MSASESTAALSPRNTLQRLASWTVLFQAGENIFVTFGLFAALGGFVGAVWTSTVLAGMGLPLRDVALLLTGVLVGHIVLARVFLLPWRLPGLLQRPREILRTVEFATWGGYIAIAIGLILYAVLSGRSLFALMDAAALGGPLAHAVGRIGCLTFGCCFGRPSTSLLAIRYDNPSAKAARIAGLRGVPIHPVPLYEAIFDLGLFFLLNAVALAGSREGVLAAGYLLLYGSARFLLEFLRYNSADDHIGALPRNQWLSLLLVSSGAALLAALWATSGPDSPSIGDGSARALFLLPLFALGATVVFFGYSLHRGSLGRW